MKISMRTLLIGAVSATLMAGCSPTGEMTRAQQGALIGAIGGAVVGKIGREKKSLAPTVTPLSKRGELKKEKKMSPAECLRLMGIDLANPCTW